VPLGPAAELDPPQPRDLQLQLLDHQPRGDDLGITLDEQTLQRCDVIGQLIQQQRHGRDCICAARALHASVHRGVAGLLRRIIGCQLRAGRLQSMPSSSIDSCAAVNETTPPSACGQTKRPRLQPLGEQTQAIAAPPQQLDPIASAAAEDEDVSRKRILGQLGGDLRGQPIEALAHVGVASR
jgi:hypothetical protein